MFKSKKIRVPFTNPLLRLFYSSYYKSWKMRRLGHEMVDNTSKIAHYVPHGTIKHFNTNKRVGKFRLITWLPFIESDESYIEPEDARWEFIGYLKCKPLVKMSFREFLKMRK